MGRRCFLIAGCLFWFALHVSSFSLQEEWLTSEDSKRLVENMVAEAKGSGSYYFVLRNDLPTEVYYRVIHDMYVGEGFVASGLEKCVVVPPTRYKQENLRVHVGRYAYYENMGAYVFVIFKSSALIRRGSSWAIETDGIWTFFASCDKRLNTGIHVLCSRPMNDANARAIEEQLLLPTECWQFTKEEFEESAEIYTEITNGLTSLINVTLSCMLVHVFYSEDKDEEGGKHGLGVNRESERVWEEQVPAGTKLHRVKLKKAWIQYAIDRPWVMTMSGEVDGFGRFSCRVEPLSASDTDHHLNRHSHYELSLKHNTEKPGIEHVAAVQMKATITKLNSEHHTYTKECAKMEE